jgi:hypothetical protein
MTRRAFPVAPDLAEEAPAANGFWRGVDGAAFGLIYGAITALGLLMAMGAHVENAFAMAAALFGSVLAITLAKAFAEVVAKNLESGGDGPRASFRSAWRHARPTLVAANLPSLLLLAAGFGALSPALAIALSQGFGILLLLVVGGRVGWVVGRRARSAALGALFTGGIGVALAGLKYILH